MLYYMIACSREVICCRARLLCAIKRGRFLLFLCSDSVNAASHTRSGRPSGLVSGARSIIYICYEVHTQLAMHGCLDKRWPKTDLPSNNPVCGAHHRSVHHTHGTRFRGLEALLRSTCPAPCKVSISQNHHVTHSANRRSIKQSFEHRRIASRIICCRVR